MVAEVLIPGDNTPLVILSCEGYRRYRLDHIADLHLEINRELPDVITKFEPILGGCCDVIVTLSSPNKIKIQHKETLAITCEYTYSFNVLAVRTNRRRVVVYTDETIFIHKMPNMKLLYTIKDAYPNPRGILALTKKNCVNCLLAYPESATSGNVQIFDAGRLQRKTLIRAHKNSLAALGFNTGGTRIATASRTGCVIKVFSSDDGQFLYEFQRGLARCVDVCSLTFSTCDNYLCCNSNTETVHVFSVKNQDSWTSYLSSFVFKKRAFATAYLPKKALQSVSSVTTVGNQLRLLVATEGGHLYVYNMDPNTGGTLSLLKEHRIGYYSGPSNLNQSLKEDSEDTISTVSINSTTTTES